MSEFTDLIKDINIPKQLLDKGEALLKTLFGPSFEEMGGLISDQVKLRRFKNQIKIFGRAQEFLLEKNIDPKKVSLKVLAPLIEYSSLEEDESLQEKWSNLTANILQDNEDVLFQQNCITVLNRISADEAKLMDTFHEQLTKRQTDRYKRKFAAYERNKKFYGEGPHPRISTEFPLETFAFVIGKLSKELKIPTNKLEFRISNLVSLGLLKWETDVEVSAKKSNNDPDDDDINVDVEVSNNDIFIFTPLGDKFVLTCKTPI